MDLGLNRRRKQQKVISDGLKEMYPHDMNLYSVPPGNEISLSEFEDLALDRLKVLRIIEYANNKGLKVYSAEWKNIIYEEMQKENLKKFLRLIKSNGTTNPKELDYQARRADHISHYILRLAYCRSDELRKWFLNKEMDLFKLRFSEQSPQSIVDFFQVYNLQYNAISEDEKEEMREELSDSTAGLFVFDTTPFYKVPFTDVINLIKNRRVFVKNGLAYVPNFEMVTVILTLFRVQLNEALAYACKRLPGLDDDRINYLLTNLHSVYTGNDFAEPTDKTAINAANLNMYAKSHYPLCMRHIHEIFRSTHHLKHGCRLQYLLFLKGIGLMFDDCMQFWREEFTRTIDGDKFDKQYAYMVKHTYGKVGSMQNYAPFSCMKIISSGVGTGEHHGCPFRHWDSTVLKKKLEENGINGKGVSEIAEFSQKGHYQIACGKYFECVHHEENKNPIHHPNQYFEDSYALANGGKVNAPSTGHQQRKTKFEHKEMMEWE